MGRVIARLHHDDGMYRYGMSTTPAPHLGPLFSITATGGDRLPEAPCDAATEEQHEAWLSSLRASGYTVTVTPLEESNIN